MSSIESLAERVRRGQSISFPMAAFLSSLTPLTRWGISRRLRMPAARVPAYVISVGNLTAGGTGKTPAVIERAKQELAEGRRVGVLTRGYGAPSGSGEEASPDVPPEEWADRLGDEPAMMLRKIPELVVIKNADRVAGAHRAMREFGCKVLILDDGFQYTALDRDENVLVVDASNPFGNGALLPRGILREPIEGMSRATSILLAHCDRAEHADRLNETLAKHCPDTPIRRTIHAPTGLRRQADGSTMPLEKLKGLRIEAACALANPEYFFDTLEDLGATIVRRSAFRDHESIPTGILRGSAPVVITEKDAVKIEKPVEDLLVLEMELRDFD